MGQYSIHLDLSVEVEIVFVLNYEITYIKSRNLINQYF